MIFSRTLCHDLGFRIKVYLNFSQKWHKLAIYIKIEKFQKPLNDPKSCSPPLVQEAPSSLTRGVKKGPMKRQTPPESHVDGSCEGY